MKKYSFLAIALVVLLQVNNYVLAEIQTASHIKKANTVTEAAKAHEAAAEAHKAGK